MSRTAAVFVHGIFSNGDVWKPLVDELNKDEFVRRHYVLDHSFTYHSPKKRWSALSRIPDLRTIAEHLHTMLITEPELVDATRIALIGHSQGGLVIQQYLADRLREGRGHDLARIRTVMMFATPNHGSELLLSVRQWFDRLMVWRHRQERTLRPLNEEVSATARIIQQQVVHAQQVSSSTCPIRFYVYAGEQDNVVTPASARSVFPGAGVLPGNHSTVIQPGSTKLLIGSVKVALRNTRTDLIPDATVIETRALDASNVKDVEATVAVLRDRFTSDEAIDKSTLGYWLHHYEEKYNLRLSVITARVDNEIAGCVMYTVFGEIIVIDYLALKDPTNPLGRVLVKKMVDQFKRNVDGLGVTAIVYEVEDPAYSESKIAAKRIHYFQRYYGARVVNGIQFRAVDMARMPRPETESPYLLMYHSNSKMPGELSREQVAELVDLIYKRWYGNWLKKKYGGAELDDYLDDLTRRVTETIEDQCPLREWSYEPKTPATDPQP